MTRKKLPLAAVKPNQLFEFRGRSYRAPSTESFWLKQMHIGDYVEVTLDLNPNKRTRFKKDTLVIVYEE